MLPWRIGANSTKETGLPVTIPPNAKDTDFVVGQWHDGQTTVVKSMTYGKLKELSRSNRGQSCGIEYEIEGKETKHRIVLVQKIDRRLLLIMREQNKQICEVKLSAFAPIQDETKRIASNHPATVAALKIMIPLAEGFAKGSLMRTELFKKRDELLADAGIQTWAAKKAKVKQPPATPPPKIARKRPAAAEADEPDDKGVEETETRKRRDSAAKPASSSGGASGSRGFFDAPPPPLTDAFDHVVAFFGGTYDHVLTFGGRT